MYNNLMLSIPPNINYNHSTFIHVVNINCGVPRANNNGGVTLAFNSTLEGSQLEFWCDEYPNDTMIASCLSDGRWSIDLEQYSCAEGIL